MRTLCQECGKVKDEYRFTVQPWVCDACYFRMKDMPHKCAKCGERWVSKESAERCCDGQEEADDDDKGNVPFNPS